MRLIPTMGVVTSLCLLVLGQNALGNTIPPSQSRLAADYSREHRGLSLLVLQHGRVIFEEYHNGHSAAEPWMLASGTKSITGVAALLAVEDGLLTLDEKVSDTVTEWRSDPKRAKITVRQLLSLVSGLPGGGLGRAPSFDEAVQIAATAEPGKSFQYGPVPFQAFGALLQRKLAAKGRAMSVQAYIQNRLLAPMGIDSTRWQRVNGGDAQLAGGAWMTARDWAKFGEYVRLRGKVEKGPKIRPELLEALFRPFGVNPAYGMTWWLNNPATHRGARRILNLKEGETLIWTGGPKDLAMAAGAAQQRLYVIPSMGLTIVRQGRMSQFQDDEFLSRLFSGKSAP